MTCCVQTFIDVGLTECTSVASRVKVPNAILQQRTFGPYMELSVAAVQKVERDQKEGAKPKKIIMPRAG